MTSTKVQPPRKLTEEETLDTFEDFWFQCECYYSRDPKFAPFFDDKNLTWRDRTVANRGLQNAETAANLNSTESSGHLHFRPLREERIIGWD